MNSRALLAVAAVLALAACHPRPAAQKDWKAALAEAAAKTKGRAIAGPRPGDTRRFDLGRMLVVERTDKNASVSYIAATTVIAATPEDAARIDAVLQAVFPDKTGGPTGPASELGLRAIAIGGPTVKTLDDHIDGMRASEEREKAERGKVAFPLDYERIRAEIAADLAGRDAVVYRYLHERKD